jgi:GAF domain-containing protein
LRKRRVFLDHGRRGRVRGAPERERPNLPPPAFAELRRRLPEIRSSGVLARVAVTKQLLHIADCTEDPSYKQGDDDFVAFVDLCGVRTLLDAPLLKRGELIGTIALYRQEVHRFTDQQVELVRNFAAQAVIAIENARLLKELRERTEEVEKLNNQQLEQRVSDQVGEIERMSRLRRFLPPQVADLIVARARRLCRSRANRPCLPNQSRRRFAEGAPGCRLVVCPTVHTLSIPSKTSGRVCGRTHALS